MNIAEAIESIISKSRDAIPINEGDYIKDGLWYCGKCDTPKQCRIEMFGHEKMPMALCKCMQEAKAEEERRRKQAEREKRIAELRRICFQNDELQNCTFEADDQTNEAVVNVAKKYVENFKRMKGLLLYGNVGSGKTFIAACIANALIDKGVPCLITNFARLINTISGMYEGRQDYIDDLQRYDLLIIDDLASERDTEYASEIIYNVIDARYRSGKPLIVTTNLTSQELTMPNDMRRQRIYSRLLEMCVPVKVDHQDRRKEKAKTENKEIKELLGLKGETK